MGLSKSSSVGFGGFDLTKVYLWPTMDDSSHISFPVARIFWELLEFLSERGIGLKKLTYPPLVGLLADALIDGMSDTPS